MILHRSAATAAALFCANTLAAQAAPLNVPFDFSHSEIGLDVNVKGSQLYMILDTGVDPSVIDLARAEKLGLKIDRTGGGEASGEGNDKTATVFPTSVTGLTISGRAFAPIDALAFDMSGLSTRYGRTLDGVLGFSFLKDKVVLIDYAKSTLGIEDKPEDAAPTVGACHEHWSTSLHGFDGDNIPIIDAFRFGTATAPISLDTGSNGGISLYQAALDLPGLRAALVEQGETTYTGARGSAKAKTYALQMPVGFGPFSLPAGQIVTMHPEAGSRDTRLANIGNQLFAEMSLKVLLDYRTKQMTFYGSCP